MAVYWITFRFSQSDADGRSYAERYDAFQAVFSDLTDKVWAEPTAFVVFEAQPSIEVVAALFREAIDPDRDMFLLHAIDQEDAILCGAAADPDILLFMPHLRTLV